MNEPTKTQSSVRRKYRPSPRRRPLEPYDRRSGEPLSRPGIEIQEQAGLQHLDLDHDQRAVAHDAVDPRIERQLGQRAQRRGALLRHLARRHLGAARGAEARVDPELALRRPPSARVTDEPLQTNHPTPAPPPSRPPL